ncbi:MAG: hypothetical protein MRECE_56c002 [Mycoplasmataceae bacterium CE_OT135]|nr:MAG: hypothetical protein MRECE_56c002 [Mycoplasmataceae bacterium CE_OT135]
MVGTSLKLKHIMEKKKRTLWKDHKCLNFCDCHWENCIKPLKLSPLSVAKYFWERGIDDYALIQDFIYLTYIESLWKNVLLFEEKYQAWEEEPVLESVYQKMRSHYKNKAKIICIAPEFDDYAIGVEEWKEEIYLIKINKYKDKKGDLFILLQTKEKNSEIINSSNNIKEINKLKEWISQKIEPLIAKKSLIMKEVRKGVCWDFIKTGQKAPILSIWFKNQSGFYSKPTIFLVNPSDFLEREFPMQLVKGKGKNSYYGGTHFYLIETEKNNGLIRAQQLITEFIKEKS